ncbi:MAG TPA: hypothetical protein VJR89_19515 [Polyangiales bacterium]|nr:hypothetical protein [Polyangiales bacterium]
MKRIRLALACAWLTCAAALAYAEPKGADALRAAASAETLELARTAARCGDDVVLGALAAADDPSLQLAAIRAAPYIVDRHQALLPLAQIAGSRDPELAARAAWKALTIAQELVREHLEVREIVPSELAPAKRQLSAVQADASARPDIRVYAGQAAHLLASLGVP